MAKSDEFLRINLTLNAHYPDKFTKVLAADNILLDDLVEAFYTDRNYE